MDGDGDALKVEVVDADVFGIAATGVGGFEEDAGGDAGERSDVVGLDVAEAARGTKDVAINITDVNRGAGETGSASSEVLSSAQSLSSESNRLKMELRKFLNTVRAA